MATDSFNANPPALSFRVEDNFSILEALRPKWDQIVAELHGTIYMTFDWLILWWKYYGDGNALRVYIFEVEGYIVGIVPIYIDLIGIWPFQAKIARLVGSNIPPKVFDPPISEQWSHSIFEALTKDLLTIQNCDLISLGPISSQNPSWCNFIPASGTWNSAGTTSIGSKSVHTVFDLPNSMEDFLKPFGKNRTKYRGRLELRPIKKLHSNAFTDTISNPSAIGKEFDRFAAQHAEQWRAEGKPGHFGDWPYGHAYNRELVIAHAALGRLRFTRVIADDKVIASQYIFSFAGCYYWELPSREVGSHYDDFRLGSTATLTMVKTAIEEKITHIEGGLGHYPYKLELGGKEHETHVYLVRKNNVLSLIRINICDALKWILSYGYNRVWFRRIQPRLPASFHVPQWRFSIRHDY